MIPTTLMAGLVAAPLLGLPQDDAPSTSWTVHADTLYVGPGEVLENAIIRVEDGKITAVSKGDAPGRHPASLRMGAAACVRAGLDKGAALATLTTSPASLAGATGRVGAIAAGHDADLVLWSGDPMDLTSAVRRVWIDGETVHETTASDEAGDDE